MTEGTVGEHIDRLDDLVAGCRVRGIDPAGPVAVVAVAWHGTQAISLTYRGFDGHGVAERLLFRSDEGTFRIEAPSAAPWSLDADGHRFRLVAEARRIQLAHLFDPYVALSSSQVDPLPHQIEAVYGEMLRRQPLRYLLADDPGAGKTIMAGLYIKELIIRGDLERCLIVAPGSLVTQWQDELRDKFALRFDLLTKDLLDSLHLGDVFQEHPRLIARVDQLARRDDVVERLRASDWDLVVVDEAHRLSAHFFGTEVKKTKKYVLGEALGSAARHFLLMTATPHAGKEEDFQLFLALLDADRFEGRFRDGVNVIDPSDLMRRMVKEKLLTFEGKPLFPERRATTVKYTLSPGEMALYDAVTTYVREQMGRADRLKDEGQGRRGNTIGFALTLLQRRLASSPEAIYQSLSRRRTRLESRVIEERQRARLAALGVDPTEQKLSALMADDDWDDDEWDELAADERESLEVEVVDAATAAATVAELEAEIATLARLEAMARDVRAAGTDRKWQQLSDLLAQRDEMFHADGGRRKLIVFTEHRDTMNYLVDRLRAFLGQEAVVAISGGTPREQRRAIQQAFTQDPECLVLVATDAAGEGLNLQRAHLVINYDLPWNPNRIEQRFGRVHRIGQTEVCHMWNLVAEETREAQVYLLLLDKIAEQQRAYKGQVFDVLGEVMSGAELRRLLVEAIRYGERPEVRAEINRVIDATVGDKVREKIEHPPLAVETMAFADVDRIRLQMEEAAARRLQPHYVRAFFQAALEQFGSSLVEREPGRFELRRVPAVLRDRDRLIGRGAPIGERYERITFERHLVRVADAPLAELVAPGHPLLRAVIDVLLERHRHLLRQGAVLVDDDPARDSDAPRVLVMLEHEIANARPSETAAHTVVSRRFEFVEISADGSAVSSGYAPYLDYRPPTEEESPRAKAVVGAWRSAHDVEELGRTHAIEVSVPGHLANVRLYVQHRVDATLAAVRERLIREINHWDHRANELQLRLDAGEAQALNVDRFRKRAEELAQRLKRRSDELIAERTLVALPPTVVGAALVVPAGLLRQQGAVGVPTEPSPLARAEVERRAIDAVLDAEHRCGWDARDLNIEQRNHPGYDVLSIRPGGGEELSRLRFVEVKGRAVGAATVTVSRNEILTALNEPERFVLALVAVRPDGNDAVRYVRHPYRGDDGSLFGVASVNFDWDDLWAQGREPELFDEPIGAT